MSNSINQLAESGRGIKLMWQIADEISYTRTVDGRNCLLLIKNYQAASTALPKNIKKPSALDLLLNNLKSWEWQAPEEQAEELNESIVQEISLQVNNDLNALADVLQWYEQLEYLSLPTEVWWGCQLALAEGFTNAVRHAHKNLPDSTPVQLEITVFKDRLELKIWDCGQSFNLNAKIGEIMAADRKNSFALDSFNDTKFVPSKTKKLAKSMFPIAG